MSFCIGFYKENEAAELAAVSGLPQPAPYRTPSEPQQQELFGEYLDKRIVFRYGECLDKRIVFILEIFG